MLVGHKRLAAATTTLKPSQQLRALAVVEPKYQGVAQALEGFAGTGEGLIALRAPGNPANELVGFGLAQVHAAKRFDVICGRHGTGMIANVRSSLRYGGASSHA
jgi:hypothetical protein